MAYLELNKKIIATVFLIRITYFDIYNTVLLNNIEMCFAAIKNDISVTVSSGPLCTLIVRVLWTVE